MLLSVILAEEPLRAAARFDRLPAVTCCDSAKDMQSCGFRDSQTILNEKAASFPLCETALCRGFAFFPPREIIIGWITDDFQPCQTVLYQGLAFFPPCEIIIGWVTDDFPPCQTVLCRGFTFFPLCQTTLRQGEVCFPLCETFVGWVMKEFPCRKVVRDGYEVHCLPAIRLETVMDDFLAIAIGLEMFTDEIATLTK